MRTVAILYARKDSIYKTMVGCDVFDELRDARTFMGGCPVVCHPPCRLWGVLRGLSTAPASEKELAIHAVKVVKENGGCLEHPRSSKLWSEMRLPLPGDGVDDSRGFTISLPQFWFGHLAFKATWLYIVGVGPKDIPEVPLVLGSPSYTVATNKKYRSTWKERGIIGEITRPQREATPPEFAKWLVSLARRTKV